MTQKLSVGLSSKALGTQTLMSRTKDSSKEQKLIILPFHFLG